MKSLPTVHWFRLVHSLGYNDFITIIIMMKQYEIVLAVAKGEMSKYKASKLLKVQPQNVDRKLFNILVKELKKDGILK